MIASNEVGKTVGGISAIFSIFHKRRSNDVYGKMCILEDKSMIMKAHELQKALKAAVETADARRACGDLESAGNYYILASQIALDLGLEGDSLGFDIKARHCYHM